MTIARVDYVILYVAPVTRAWVGAGRLAGGSG
jgi:hypothetical protein